MGNTLFALANTIGPESTDDELLHLASRFHDEPDDVRAIAALARRLAQSGRVEAFSEHAADVASTGGPGSLTTLLCPLILVLAGWDVPKLTVPGRPAGGIDVLMTIPGYRGRASIDEVRSWIQDCHYAHFLATNDWAPVDGRLFELRKKHGHQRVRSLVVASILSKKVALTLSQSIVEIRRGRFGNLGDDENELQLARALFEQVGQLLGVPCKSVVTGSGQPYQPYIGRGEALIALHKIFSDECTPLLQEHVKLCRYLVDQVQTFSPVPVNHISMREVFEANLIAQGSTYAAFTERVATVSSARRIVLYPAGAGQLSWDLGILRAAIVGHQGDDVDGIPGDECGVVLDVINGHVDEGTPIAHVRGTDDVARAIERAAVISPENS